MGDRRQNILLVLVTLALILTIAAAPARMARWIKQGRFIFASAGRPAVRPAPLPVVGTFAKFKELMKESRRVGRPLAGLARHGAAWGMAGQKMILGAEAAKDSSYISQDFPHPNYSDTNIQVAGVDEADIVKTDGQYIYRVHDEKISITKVVPAGAMKVASAIMRDRAPGGFRPRELYVDGPRLIVVGTAIRPGPSLDGVAGLSKRPEMNTDPENERLDSLWFTDVVTKVVVYDISDRAAPTQIREAAVDGAYLSSRKVGPALYLVSNKTIYDDVVKEGADSSKAYRPTYMDSAISDRYRNIDFGRIKYFPDLIEPNYLLVAGINLDEPDREMQVSTYLGAGQNIYASTENLYVAVTQYKPEESVEPQSGSASGLVEKAFRPPTAATRVYKFAFNQGKVDYRAQGEVPGTILNQYSMDESGGHFRLATTTGEAWSDGEDASENNLYVLDGDMKVVGRLEGLAPGERIYSTRFMGERAYVVTFKQVDPLFVIDLKDPSAPRVLGELKIPGYSDYLHPYDENHIIGFGKEAVEMQGTALYQGMKVALFDVSDVAHPVEKFKTTIGDRGTDSELLHNPKALLFDRERNLMAFPVTVLEVKGNRSPQSYGEFAFQGAYVYDISLDKGLNLKGRIGHQSAGDKGPGGMFPYGDGDKIVDRALYIGDVLYTVSKAKIQANSMADLKKIGSVDIPN